MPPPATTAAATLTGVLERIIFLNEENHYTIAEFRPDLPPAARAEGKRAEAVTIIGALPGVECGGAIKNVIAIAAGAADGCGFGHNTRAMLITRGLSEMVKLSLARGGEAITLAGLAGMGDLVLTCTGELSRNRTVGLELGKGRKLPDIIAGLGHVAEGVKTTKSAYDLSHRLGIELPIINEVYRVLYEDKPVLQAVKDLMSRDLTSEFESIGTIKSIS